MPDAPSPPRQSQFTLRARVVLPLRRPPIENGAVVVSENRIAAVGPWPTLQPKYPGPVVDLGDSLLLPGLVNAHCHLDYTHMAALFPPPKRFSDWIKLITTEKSQWSFSDFAQSWLAGAPMLVRTGTTTVGDIEAVPQLLPHVWDATPLRVISFLEMTGIRSRRDPDAILAEAIAAIDALPSGRCRAGLSPHAPYSTLPRLLKLCGATARQRRWQVATHVAESEVEFEMFTRAEGDMYDWLKRNQRDMTDCGGVSPVQHLARTRLLGPNLLAAHVNFLADGDAELLARRKVSVVHCPRSHEYFGHAPFPRNPLAKAGVNLCLGTDSLATVLKFPRQNLELNLFHEMRLFARRHPDVAPEGIVQMATLNGALALGLHGKVGELRRWAFADMIAVPFTGRTSQSYEAVVQHTGNVSASVIDGDWAVSPQAS